MCGSSINWDVIPFMPQVSWYFNLKIAPDGRKFITLRYRGLTKSQCESLLDRQWEDNLHGVSVGENNGVLLNNPAFPPKADCAALNGGIIYIGWMKD